MLSKILTKLVGRRGLARTLLLLPLATARTSPLNSSTPTATTAATTTPIAATTAAATTAATNSSTPTTTPSATTTASTASTTASTAATPTTVASLAPAASAPPSRSRRSPDLLSTKEVNSCSRSDKGYKGGSGNTPQ
ncbi:unnamed protein product [Closterium sp. NIES-53]